MPETVVVREDLQIIHVDSYGDVTIEDLESSLDAVLQIRRERGLTKVLVDASKETSLPSLMRIYDFGSNVAANLRGVRIAVAISPHTQEDLSFMETVARNRGALVAVFVSVDAALAWLMSEAE